MGTQRTSNKDIADKLDTLISILTANAQAQVAAPVVETPKATPTNDINIPEGYMNHMANKLSKLVALDGQKRVLYARRNQAGEVKLAYCLKSRWATLKDGGLIGAVQEF